MLRNSFMGNYMYTHTYIYIYIYRQLHKNAASNIEEVLEATPQLYGHLPSITKTIKVRRTRHAGHCWRRRDELISDVLLWTPTYGRAKAGQPARTFIQQLCEDTGCSPEDLPDAMNDRERWRERDIRDSATTWWYIYIYIERERGMCVCVCEREREREREILINCVYTYMYVWWI